jgi:hypothetical protein
MDMGKMEDQRALVRTLQSVVVVGHPITAPMVEVVHLEAELVGLQRGQVERRRVCQRGTQVDRRLLRIIRLPVGVGLVV